MINMFTLIENKWVIYNPTENPNRYLKSIGLNHKNKNVSDNLYNHILTLYPQLDHYPFAAIWYLIGHAQRDYPYSPEQEIMIRYHRRKEMIKFYG